MIMGEMWILNKAQQEGIDIWQTRQEHFVKKEKRYIHVIHQDFSCALSLFVIMSILYFGRKHIFWLEQINIS